MVDVENEPVVQKSIQSKQKKVYRSILVVLDACLHTSQADFHTNEKHLILVLVPA